MKACFTAQKCASRSLFHRRLGTRILQQIGLCSLWCEINENAARTLEYAYDDWCIYKLAKELKRPKKEINLFAKRAMNYKNLFDKESKLMRGRNEDGTFQSPFSPWNGVMPSLKEIAGTTPGLFSMILKDLSTWWVERMNLSLWWILSLPCSYFWRQLLRTSNSWDSWNDGNEYGQLCTW